MLIAIDHDNTYTRDPDFWLGVIDSAINESHQVICVTTRFEDRPITDERLTSRIKVIHTKGKAKREFCANLGVKPDVWIDDLPESILRNEV